MAVPLVRMLVMHGAQEQQRVPGDSPMQWLAPQHLRAVCDERNQHSIDRSSSKQLQENSVLDRKLNRT